MNKNCLICKALGYRPAIGCIPEDTFLDPKKESDSDFQWTSVNEKLDPPGLAADVMPSR